MWHDDLFSTITGNQSIESGKKTFFLLYILPLNIRPRTYVVAAMVKKNQFRISILFFLYILIFFGKLMNNYTSSNANLMNETPTFWIFVSEWDLNLVAKNESHFSIIFMRNTFDNNETTQNWLFQKEISIFFIYSFLCLIIIVY